MITSLYLDGLRIWVKNFAKYIQSVIWGQMWWENVRVSYVSAFLVAKWPWVELLLWSIWWQTLGGKMKNKPGPSRGHGSGQNTSSIQLFFCGNWVSYDAPTWRHFACSFESKDDITSVRCSMLSFCKKSNCCVLVTYPPAHVKSHRCN